MGHMPPNVYPVGITDTVLSVKNYGAVGNGVADDTAALVAALAAAAGKQLRFPPGTYRCTSVLTPAASTQLLGEGGEIVFVDDGSASGIRILVQANDVTIDGLKLRDTSAARTAVYGLVSVVNCARARVVDCVFGNSASTAVWTSLATDFEIRGNNINGTRADGIHVSRGSIRGVIANNVIRNTGDDGIGVISLRTLDGVTACDPCSNITIANNVITAPTPIGRGIALDGSRHITVDGNVIKGTPNQGILAGGGGTSYYPAFLTITNNSIDTPTSAGVHITYCRGLIVEGNSVHASTDVGVSLIGAQYSCRVVNNTLNRCARSIVVTQTASANAALLADLFTNLGDTAPATMVVDRLSISGNLITAQSSATSTCISAVGEAAANMKRVLITDNVMQVITGGVGVQLTYAEDCRVEGNTIDGDNKGIGLAEVDRATVESNRLKGCYLEHVTNGTNALIIGNTIYGATSSAINVGSGCTGTYVYDNDVRSSTAMSLASGTIADRNIGPSVEIAPSQITGNQNNYTPTNFEFADVLFLTSDASRDITGFGVRTSKPFYYVYNGGANNIVLKHNSGSSDAGKKIFGRGNADTTITPGTGVKIFYSTLAGSVHVVLTDSL